MVDFLPSREIDAVVAERILGWTLAPNRNLYVTANVGGYDAYNMVPHFTFETHDAIDYLWDRTSIQWIKKMGNGLWLVSFILREDKQGKYMEIATAPTPALAIVKAALLKHGLIECENHPTEDK